MSEVFDEQAHDDLTVLVGLDRSALAERWETIFGCPAPLNCRSTLLRGALAWHYQMANSETAGSGAVDQLLRRLQRKLARSTAASLAPGTRLLREWHGLTHHVTVLDSGFEYGGKTYRSLTAISRQITGTAWSGPKFFGLHP